MASVPQRLQDLYAVAARVGEQLGHSAEGVFDPCGLILEIPPRAGYYWCTPRDALTFAATGGDGVHYSYLCSDQVSSSVVPVIMTLPAAETHNVVLAENLDEFFGLGYHVGWFALEQVIHQPEAAVAYFAQRDPEDPDYKTFRMDLLRSQLGIRPVALVLERVTQLTKAYSSFLVVPDEPGEI